MSNGLNILKALVGIAIQNSASDIHIRTDESPSFRMKGELFPLKSDKLISAADISEICQLIFPPSIFKNFESLSDYDSAYELDTLCRLRYNFFRYNGKIGLILRIIPQLIQTIDNLGLSLTLKEIVKVNRGLILVTGATGQGKTTTLAAMIDEINDTQSKHIVTIEDPIEYLHTQKKCRVTQREIGPDVKDFAVALRGALRQDPNIIFIGELRDRETIEIALKAAETGHLVLATIHTTDALTTIGRIISMFTPEEVVDVKKRLAESLFATISQRMIRSKKSKRGVVVAQEIMITGPGVRECIIGTEPLERIVSIIEKGGTNAAGLKCQSFDQNIKDLFNRKMITQEDAEAAVKSKVDFLRSLVVS